MATPIVTPLGPLAAALYEDLIRDPRIYHLWAMNENSGVIYDRGDRFRANGTVSGNPTYAKSLGNGFYGLDFDGTGDYVDLGAFLNFERTDAFSVLCLTNPNTAGSDALIGHVDSSNIGWYLNVETGVGINMRLLGAAQTIRVRSNTALTNGTTAMVGMSYSGSSTAAGVTIYINGAAVADTDLTDTLTSASIVHNSNSYIGRATTSLEEYNGDIGFVAILVGGTLPSARDFRRWAFLSGFV